MADRLTLSEIKELVEYAIERKVLNIRIEGLEFTLAPAAFDTPAPYVPQLGPVEEEEGTRKPDDEGRKARQRQVAQLLGH